ncbi:ribosome recycling factor [Alphaproteobacteria bacterium]|nr:ribosome recycling factor [Alphaproteobacteria bacterium]
MAEIDMEDVKRRMEGALSNLSNEFSGLRAGRASVAMLDPVSVDAYGSKMPISQLSNVSVPESRLLSVSVWDASLVSAVEKAIRESDLGLNPQVEGSVIRVPVPELSEDRRKDMAKVASRYAEAGRVSVRNVRRDAIETVRKDEKAGEISEDERHNYESDIQKITNGFVGRIDDMLSKKEKDITQV